jgi:hypothetical protein
MKSPGCIIKVKVDLYVPFSYKMIGGVNKSVGKKICEVEITNRNIAEFAIFGKMTIDNLECVFRKEASSGVVFEKDATYNFTCQPKFLNKKEMQRLVDCDWELFPQAIKQFKMIVSTDYVWLTKYISGHKTKIANSTIKSED